VAGRVGAAGGSKRRAPRVLRKKNVFSGDGKDAITCSAVPI